MLTIYDSLFLLKKKEKVLNSLPRDELVSEIVRFFEFCQVFLITGRLISIEMNTKKRMSTRSGIEIARPILASMKNRGVRDRKSAKRYFQRG